MWLFPPQLHAVYAHQWTNVWLLNFWCGHWTTVVFIELLRGYWTNEELICTCSPTLVPTKGTKAHQRNVSSARLIVYTAHFIRAGLDFQDRVPILSVLGLPLDMVRARVKFWSGTDGAKSFTRLNLSVPNQFFWYTYFFHPSRAKNFLPCKWGLSQPLELPEPLASSSTSINTYNNCPDRDFAQKAKSRGASLVARMYIKETTYSRKYTRKNLNLLEQGPHGIIG